MVYDKDYDEKELAYDLRQSFVQIVTAIKQAIVIARRENDFPNWYGLLDSLYIEVCKNLDNDEMKEYEELKSKSLAILHKCNATFLKKSSKDKNEVYQALRTLDIWVNRKMNEKNMFGSRDLDEGL